MTNLGTLKEITDLRSIWPHEALNFTPWVAENVDLLADAVGLDITVDETESSVGDFNVDIYASETGTDRKIIIENQLEDTDHDHLGKLITYASGKGADVVIWGLRAITDFEYELQMSQTNQRMKPDIETMFLTTSIEYSYLSSTTVREIAAFGGDVSQFVPEAVEIALREKMKEKRRV